jgi:hypothetical protein
MLAALPYPPQTSRRLLYLLLAVLLWHLLLPGWFYHTPAVYLEGPLPAVVGVAFGLWLHQAETLRLQALGACGWGIFASMAAVLIGGSMLFGPLTAIVGLYALVRNVFHIPFIDAFRAIGSGYLPYVIWMGIKTLLAWGAIGYIVLLFTHLDLASRFRDTFASHGVNRTFTREQRKQAADYRRRYVEAVKAGGTPPPTPPGLVALGPGMTGAWHNRARFAYWAVRIGIALAGVVGLWSAFKDQLFGMGGQIFMRGLLGGG